MSNVQQMMHREQESPLPALSASTGTLNCSLEGASESSFERVRGCSGSSRKKENSTYVSIAVSVEVGEGS